MAETEHSAAMPTDRLDLSSSEAAVITLKKVRLLVTDGPDKGTDVIFDGTPVRIGKLPESDLVLQDRTVSKEHALIERKGDSYVLRDLGSTNGTFVNDVRVETVHLTPGTLIRMGHTTVKFHPRDEDMVVLPREGDVFHGIIGGSARMRQVMAILERVAATDVGVVLYGETGTGKEVAAKALHEASPRMKKPFVVFDCGNTDKELVRSELFGHEVGAFTGATAQRLGAFEQANGGTLFLDEIGELPLDLQPKLLRVLEQRTIQRLGASSARKIDVRLVCATHRNLEEMVARGEFREDLFYRIAQVPINLPPLRERREDIPKLAESFLAQILEKIPDGRELHFSKEALEVLRNAEWRGNVRELRNVVERACALSAGPVINVADLLMTDKPGPIGSPAGGSAALANRSLEDVEKEAIIQSLRANQGNRKKTARILGIAPVTLREKIRKYGINVDALAGG